MRGVLALVLVGLLPRPPTVAACARRTALFQAAMSDSRLRLGVLAHGDVVDNMERKGTVVITIRGGQGSPGSSSRVLVLYDTMELWTALGGGKNRTPILKAKTDVASIETLPEKWSAAKQVICEVIESHGSAILALEDTPRAGKPGDDRIVAALVVRSHPASTHGVLTDDSGPSRSLRSLGCFEPRRGERSSPAAPR